MFFQCPDIQINNNDSDADFILDTISSRYVKGVDAPIMRVAFVVTDLGLGGTQAFVELAADTLIRLGHQVTVFVEQGPFDRQKRMEEKSIKVITFDQLPSLGNYCAQIAARRIELIHLNVWERLELLRGIKKAAGIPVVLSYHHVPHVRPWLNRLFNPRYLLSSLRDMARESRGIDAHIGCCESSAEALRTLFRPFRQQRVYALLNAIPFPLATDESMLRRSAHFLQVGSLTERKNPFATLQCFAAVVKVHPDATLTFIGGGPERGKLEAYVGERNIPGVTFEGDVADPSPYYAEANVMVLPSYSEGLPYTLIEAAGRAIPIIASDVDGIPEIVRSGKSGILVPPGDNTALSEAMSLLAADIDLRIRFGMEGRRIMQKQFDIGSFTVALARIYQDVLTRSGFGKCA